MTGQGVRQTLALIRGRIPLEVHEIPSGRSVYDSEVPLEWNIDDACVYSPDGSRVIDFRDHKLLLMMLFGAGGGDHLSCGAVREAALAARRSDVDSIPEELLPSELRLRLRREARQKLVPGQHRAKIKSSRARGSLSYGEFAISGQGPG